LLKNENNLFNIVSDAEFSKISLEIFRFQYAQNTLYKQWVDLLKIKPDAVDRMEDIPFLPIEFFKKCKIISSSMNENTVKFTSSATTSDTPATHYVTDVNVYEESFRKCFQLFYGDVSQYCILALLPNYLQRGGSSLVYMCNSLIKESRHPDSGFFLDDQEELILKIQALKETKQKTILIGVSYALMDLCDKGIELNESFTVMETGGMKGRRKELLKEELHKYLKKGFGITTVHSEYGMTELLSQAYSIKDGLFKSPPWMRFLIREVDDPLKIRTDHKTGGINVIDLANKNSCSFIATKDLGRVTETGFLELMGRYDHSDVRGCNLMMGDL
jgi:phenylacetate-coenzyme A ligase PaaK-like adenylate-forming protein